MPNYVYHNVNPLGLTESDCVIRAISLALQMDYHTVISLLQDAGDIYTCEELCVDCYSRLLTEHFQFEKVPCRGQSVAEFALQHPFGIFLIRMDGHLSCILNGVCYDIWDCTNEILTDVWRVSS